MNCAYCDKLVVNKGALIRHQNYCKWKISLKEYTDLSGVDWKVFNNILVSSTGCLITYDYPSGDYRGYLRPDNYYTVKTEGKRLSVHRLVAHLFLGLDLNSNLQVNHIDCNPQNNNVSNLEIVTGRENNQRRLKTVLGKSLGCYLKSNGSYLVQIGIAFKNKNSKQPISLGVFKTLEIAELVYKTANDNIQCYDGDNKKFIALVKNKLNL